MPFRDLCPRCSKPHGPGTCADDRANDRAPREDPAISIPDENRCTAGERCVRPHVPVPDGERYHQACGYLAEFHDRRQRDLIAAGQMQPPSPYPDDHRDELPEDYDDADHVA